MASDEFETRRRFLALAGTIGGGMALGGLPSMAGAAGKRRAEEEGEVTPVEDLMREHGVLRRVLLIYEESVRRVEEGGEVPAEVIPDSADIVRRFVEDYHEKLEENEIFPRFEKAGKLVDLTKVLYSQHQAGRRLTDTIRQSSAPAELTGPQSREKLVRSIREFIRMYRPHAAREDTVLFPVFRSVVSGKEYRVLGDRFEAKEQELFGKAGFENMVARVAAIEKSLDIDDLSRFTPHE